MKRPFRKIGIALAWRFALPPAWLWVRLHQQRIRRHGRPLSDDERRLAVALGISEYRIERIRIWSVNRVPGPGDLLLRTVGRIAGISTHSAKGMALNLGIYLEAAQANRRSLVAHELVHVAQYERLGGTWPFLRDYLWQCLREGYWNAPLEIEARQRAAEVVAG